MQLFYSNNLEEGVLTFDESESRHILKVLRHNVGDTVHVTDGRGNIFQAGIIDDNPRKCRATITGTISASARHDYYLHIAIAPTKNSDRMEWFIEKTVEMGINEITPLLCEHSERKKINKDRLLKIAISAMKQSHKSYLPKINDITKCSPFIEKEFSGKKFIAHAGSETETKILDNHYHKGENALFLIGPEGDFSSKELRKALESGFIPVSLGSSRLRTETAGITACCWVAHINQ